MAPRPVPLTEIDTQVAGFHEARRADGRASTEDYLELIADLIGSQGEARLTDLAQRLGVSHATVAKTVQRLVRDGYVRTLPYRSIFLTDEGAAIAAEAKKRHEIVHDFLLAIGVDEATAAIDAEGIEHHVSAATLAAFERVIARAGRRRR
ncbi:manganese-binding transcriptional regulator MntR [Roseiterribacter gracilis]